MNKAFTFYARTIGNRLVLGLITCLLACVTILSLSMGRSAALSGGEFNPSRIVDDAVFYNAGSMSVAQIQQFLNAKVPTCDTNGAQWHSSGRTRAQHGISKGVPPPYTCLKDYVQWVPGVTNGGSDLCTGSVAPGNKTAAQIIFDASQACGVNPQVLLVLLQKEQSLITDDWPWPIQYRSATGYGCPDTAPCDAEFYGFFNQVYQAAKAYKRYRANPTNYNYRAGRNNTVLWHPNTGCGNSNFHIDNQATAGLYIYTPYRPNQAALNNLYGTGDGCSSYGNRNFWRMFNDWFGSTTRPNGEIIISSAVSVSDASPKAGQTISISYSVQNRGSYSVDTGTLWICGELNGQVFGGGSSRKVLVPDEILTMSMTYTPTASGTMKIRACGNTPNGPGWVEGYPYAQYHDHRERWDWVNPNPMVISRAIGFSNPAAGAGETVDLIYSVKNTDTDSFDSGVLWICGSMNGQVFGGGTNRKVLSPGEVLTMTMPYTIPSTGIVQLTACGNLPNGPGWVEGYPYGEYQDHRVRSFPVKSQALRISGHVSVLDSTPTVGEATSITYQVKNFGLSNIDSGVLWICGDLNGQAFGGASARKVLVPGETLTITLPYTPTQAGKLTVTACGNLPNGPGWVEGYPYGEYQDHRVRSFQIRAN